jgi:hypothetical protein
MGNLTRICMPCQNTIGPLIDRNWFAGLVCKEDITVVESRWCQAVKNYRRHGRSVRTRITMLSSGCTTRLRISTVMMRTGVRSWWKVSRLEEISAKSWTERSSTLALNVECYRPELFIDGNMFAVIVVRLISYAVKKILIPTQQPVSYADDRSRGHPTEVRDVYTPKRAAEKQTAFCPTSDYFWRSDVRTRYAGQLRRSGKVASFKTASLKADSHIACRAHAMLRPCRSSQGDGTARPSRDCLPAFGFFRLPRGVPRRLSEAYHSQMQVASQNNHTILWLQ